MDHMFGMQLLWSLGWIGIMAVVISAAPRAARVRVPVRVRRR